MASADGVIPHSQEMADDAFASPAAALSLRGTLGEPLREQNQRGAGGGVVDRKEGLQEIETIAGQGVRDRAERGCLTRSSSRPAAGAVAAGRPQPDDIAWIATLEGPLSLDLPTRHNALPVPPITGTRWVNFHERASYVAPRVSRGVDVSVPSSFTGLSRSTGPRRTRCGPVPWQAPVSGWPAPAEECSDTAGRKSGRCGARRHVAAGPAGTGDGHRSNEPAMRRPALISEVGEGPPSQGLAADGRGDNRSAGTGRCPLVRVGRAARTDTAL